MWVRIGWIDPPVGIGEWCSSHLSMPFCIAKNSNEFRVFFNSRDSDKRSHIGWVDFDLNSKNISKMNFGSLPIVSPGIPGEFDEHGVSGSYYEIESGLLRIWNFGWRRSSGLAWTNAIGLVEKRNDKIDSISSNRLIMQSNDFEKYGAAYPYLISKGSLRYMFYGAFDVYGIPSLNETYSFISKRALIGSDLAISSRVNMINHLSGQSAQSRPCIIKDGEGYRAWISVKGEGYVIRSAFSSDLSNWHWSEDEFGLEPSGLNGEISEVCYSHVVDVMNSRFMFYNGDGFGKTGIGIAKWQA